MSDDRGAPRFLSLDDPSLGARAARQVRRLGGVDRVAAGVLAAAFVVSRVGYQLAGVRYDASLLNVSLQHLDNELLRDRLLESLWFQHTQPPLFNLLIGLVLKFSPLSPERTFHVLWVSLGAVLVAVVYRLAVALRIPRTAALVVTVVVTCSPTIILYENWLAYEYPLTVAVTSCALAAAKWVATGRLRWLATVSGLAGACVLTRALLSPPWYMGLVVLVLLARRPSGAWRRALPIVALPAVLFLGVMAKNQVLFGSPTMSSWVGWNLQRVTIDELPPDVKGRLIADGTLTGMANFPVFLPLDKYAAVTPPCTPSHPDVPVLALPVKSTGRENWNAECYLPIYEEATTNALRAAGAEPGYTARAIVGSFQIWSESSSQYAFVYDNRLTIDPLDTVYRQVVLLDVPYDPPVHTNAGWWIPIGTPGQRWRASLTIIAATALAAVVGIQRGWRSLRGRATDVDATLAVIGWTVIAITLVGNLLEIGENNRFRFVVEPITLLAWAWFLTRLVQRGARRYVRRTPSDPPGDRIEEDDGVERDGAETAPIEVA